MPKSVKECCITIRELLRSNHYARATISIDFFREIVDRHRIEKTFIETLNNYAQEHYRFGMVRLDSLRFMVFRTTDKYFKEDPHALVDGED